MDSLKSWLKLIFLSPENKKNLIILLVIILAVVALAVFLIKQASNSTPLPEGCNPGDKFSQTTGRQCKDGLLPACLKGDLFDRNTGKPCLEAEEKPVS